jgi:hypothetical protein
LFAARAEPSQVAPSGELIAHGSLGGHMEGVVERKAPDAGPELDPLGQRRGLAYEQIGTLLQPRPRGPEMLGDPRLGEAEPLGQNDFSQVLIP